MTRTTPRQQATTRPAQPALLDVNVLIALAWPHHEAHQQVSTWFKRHAKTGWVTTPVTETGLVRLSTNRAVIPNAATPATAIELLRQLTALPGHHFWPDEVAYVVAEHLDPNRLGGHRQITDAHLLALCLHHDGYLVTLDKALATLAPDRVHVIEAA